MISSKIRLFLLFLLPFTLFSQLQEKESVSNISKLSLADTAILHLEMKAAEYDMFKNNLPFYIIARSTSYDQLAIPSLVIKKTRLVENRQEEVIRRYFSKYLTKNFELESTASLSKNQNLNQYKLFPFRLNSLNKIEELLSYEVTWQVGQNTNLSARGSSSFKSNSVLASGNWYKIAITETGIHKVTKSFLAGIGINTTNLDLKKIKIYGNGGKMLPEKNKDFRYDDLEETALRVVQTSDGSLDYVLFYASGTTEWVKVNGGNGLKYEAIQNLYSDTSFYFINLENKDGKRIASKASLALVANISSTSYDYYNYHEINSVNFPKSGRDFYGEYFDLNTFYNFKWNDGGFISGDSIGVSVKLAALYSDTSTFLVNGNGVNFVVTTASLRGSTYSDLAAPASRTAWSLNSNASEIGIGITKLTPKSIGWLDKLTVNARRSLTLSNKQFSFRDSRLSGAGKIWNYTIQSFVGGNVELWNVSDPLNPYLQEFTSTSTSISFTDSLAALSEFCISPLTDFFTPTFVSKISNQNLHALMQADYLIITHPLFVNEAQRLALLHQREEGLTYAIATTEQIYNEFGSGKQDISAIRDFIRMLYSRNSQQPGKELKYVLLIGDGSYNNKSRSLINNSNLIPTYQSHNSVSVISSIATDDFYGLMDADEGYYAESIGKIDIGIGRLTCRTVNEVRTVITKIENYYKTDPNFVSNNSGQQNKFVSSESTHGDWRNWLLFVGDDDDGALHMQQSNSLASLVKSIAPTYNSDKILLDSYQRFSTPGGYRYPDASEDFLKRIKKGALIFNYTGHGGEVGLTAERIIDLDIINNLDNFNKLPLFITATCEFSRYDDPSRTSAGELCLLNSKGGSIALFTTCRLAFAQTNLTLNIELLKYIFSYLPNGKRPCLGDIVQQTKASPQLGGQEFYYANFHLLGDPALTLAYPDQKVFTSHINNIPVSVNSSDTLGSLSKITVAGFVADAAGNKLTNFNGLVYPTVFDKEQTVVCVMNTDASGYTLNNTDTATIFPFEFSLQKNILYRGKSIVKNGDFSYTFIVPKDVSFAPGKGKISYYASNGTEDASGYYDKLVVGGTSNKNVIADNEGPQINLFLNEKGFVNGGLSNEKPVLFAELRDSSGINTLGSSIGHDLSVILDANTSKPIILNDFYEADLNSYQSGSVRYPYSEISEGTHRLTFKAWDIQNNSSTSNLDFVVASSSELALTQVLNYPNPFTTRTKFLFEHNQACNPLKVTVQIYTVSGKLVKTLQQNTDCGSGTAQAIDWDGRDDYGDKLARGVYIYKLAILDVENKKAEKIEKLVILN
jgi:hypothetical protein